MKPLRIGFLCNEFPPNPHGGIGSFVHDLSRTLVQQGHQVFIVGFGTKKQKVKRNGICIDIEPSPKGTGIPHLDAIFCRIRLGRMMAKKSSRYHLDIIEAPDWKGEASFYSGQVPLVTRIHGSTAILKRPSRLTYFFEKRQLLRSRKLVAVSTHAAKLTQKAFFIGSPITSIVSGIDTDDFCPAVHSPGDNTFLFVGRFVREKGSRETLEFFERVCNLMPEATLQIVGHVPESERAFTDTSVPKHIRKAITFVGRIPREELLPYYQRSAYLLFFSKAEAFGLSVIEAMACGCIPIVAKGTAASDLITDGIDGYLHSDRFLLDRFKESQDEVRISARMSAIQKFSLSRSVEENVSMYRQIVSYKNG